MGVDRGNRAGAGQRRPSTSTMLVMVDAVPMVLHVPAERAVPSPTSRHVLSSILPAR